MIYSNSGDNLTGWTLANSGATGILVNTVNADSQPYILMGFSARATSLTSTTAAFDETIAAGLDYTLVGQARLGDTYNNRATWAPDVDLEVFRLKVFADADEVATVDINDEFNCGLDRSATAGHCRDPRSACRQETACLLWERQYWCRRTGPLAEGHRSFFRPRALHQPCWGWVVCSLLAEGVSLLQSRHSVALFSFAIYD